MIFELLSKGAANAHTAQELANLLHVDRRSISEFVEKERRAGKPICATCNSKNPGYFIAANRAEMERYCNRLLHRAGEIHKTRKACLQTMGNLPTE